VPSELKRKQGLENVLTLIRSSLNAYFDALEIAPDQAALHLHTTAPQPHTPYYTHGLHAIFSLQVHYSTTTQ
jgi:hypothetical protein